jgi:hypothetical protein
MMTLILSLLGLGGVGGLGLLAYFMGPAALLGSAKSILGAIGAVLKQIPWQVYLAAGIAAVLAFFIISRSHWINRAHGDEAKLAELCEVVRTADHNPKLSCDKAGAQVILLGQSLVAVTNALNDQTARVKALAAESARQQQVATEAEKQAKERAGEAEAVADRLSRSAAQRPSSAASAACQPSAALQEQWP